MRQMIIALRTTDFQKARDKIRELREHGIEPVYLQPATVNGCEGYVVSYMDVV